MPNTTPRESESTAPSVGSGTHPSAPSHQDKRDETAVWPRDMNSPTTKDPLWGSDPEALRDA